MEFLLQFNTVLAILTIIGIVGIVKWVILLAAHKHAKKLRLYRWFIDKKVWFWAGFIFSLIAVAGTLVYSEIIGLEPCRLCWFQRIFMYPTMLLLGLGLIRKDMNVVPYVKMLTLGGIGVAAYQYIVQMVPGVDAACGAAGASCSERLVFEFGFVTIPFMGLVAFLMIFVLMLFEKKKA